MTISSMEEDHLFRVAEDHLTIEEQARLAAEMVAVQKRLAGRKALKVRLADDTITVCELPGPRAG
jgi:hypothetical protein